MEFILLELVAVNSFCPLSKLDIYIIHVPGGRRGGLVVSTLHSGSRGPGLSSGQGIVLCSWARHFSLTIPLSTQEYKWVPAGKLDEPLGGNL